MARGVGLTLAMRRYAAKKCKKPRCCDYAMSRIFINSSFQGYKGIIGIGWICSVCHKKIYEDEYEEAQG